MALPCLEGADAVSQQLTRVCGCVPCGPLCVYSLANCHGYTPTQVLTSGYALRQEAPLLIFPSRPGGCVSFSPAHGAVCRGEPEAHSRSVQPPHPPAGICNSYSRALVSFLPK